MSTFDDFVNTVLKGAGTLAQQALQGWLNEAQSDAKNFLQSTQADLVNWANQYKNAALSKSEFQDLVSGELDLGKLAALTQAGIAEADLQRFRDGLINVIVDAAVTVLV